ncbi:MAG: DNA repair exonuclease [Acidimicrobiales bacterium]|nr:DNA repair exonuclease [Acidimicrobiales bacterium]
MKLLHCADLHIDSPMVGLTRYEGAPVERMRSATRRAAENLVQLALDRQVDVVLVGGDIFDGRWKDANTGLWWNRQLGRLVDSGIEVFIVHGNHDADSVITHRIQPPPGVHVFGVDGPTTVVSDDLPLAVHGQSYATAATTTDLAAGYPAPVPGVVNVGLLHTSLDGREGHARYAPCTPGELAAKGYALWALGHVHAREHLEVDGTHLLVPGNTQGRHAREPGEKTVSIIDTDGEAVRSVEHVPVDVVRWARVTVDRGGLDDLDAMAAAVVDRVVDEWEQAGRPLAVRVELAGDGPPPRIEHLRTQVVADLAHRSDGDIWLEKLAVRTNLLGEPPPISSEAIAAVVGSVDAAATDDDAVAHLAELLSPLQQRVSGALALMPDDEVPSSLTSPAVVRRYLPAARERLVAHLQGRG